MSESRDQKSFWTTLLSFWTTLPGVLTAIGGVILAVTGLMAALVTAGLIGGSPPVPTPVPPAATPISALPTATPNSTLVSDLNEKGDTSYRQGQYREALNYYNQALVVTRGVGDKTGEGVTLRNIGEVYLARGQYDQALENY